ncbi:hypothetical protein HK097_001501 [Rhizophlyctis rosea]|uniref:Uncharacterized protein n=1 Tax=Rhizophlyctis rosea TaxID=64517 RepID=A0AAD5X8M8_9FUNG|nr:hypothetical protein HK097_001501 [Rhizophlyctis rosea]
MEDFCDFHPKFLGEERDDLTYRGRFATFPASDAPGPSGTANTGRTSATWFYRYNSREIEVRNIRTCKEGVLARFKAADLAQTTGEERITFVTHARLAAAEYLIICTTNSSSSRLWLWDLFTFRAQLVLSSDRGSFSTATVTTAMDGPEGLRAYYVLGATGSHVHYAELLLDESGGSELQPVRLW